MSGQWVAYGVKDFEDFEEFEEFEEFAKMGQSGLGGPGTARQPGSRSRISRR
ncbi:hypothetical protein ABTY53_21655 [Streptomyces noursei]|uniref:hypothetical protein n=1 Tax=Streptomyces noursei TaxID=1971 RepID=UPI0033269B6F